MKNVVSLLIILSIAQLSFSQTFSGTGGSIPDNLDTAYFAINVAGLNPATMNNLYGLEEVCINLTHTRVSDLSIYLFSPDENGVLLTSNNGGNGANYMTTCFRQDTVPSIVNGTAPFNGSYRPERSLASLNNGQNGNGSWWLMISDNNSTVGGAGNLVDCNLTFSNNPAMPTIPEFDSTNLPIVIINTNNQTIVDEPKIICDMGIIYNGAGAYNHLTDPFNNYNGKIAIEIRGASSQLFPKKSYGFKTVNSLGSKLDTSLIGMPSESNWVLYAPYYDKTCMRDVLTYKLYRDFGNYAPRTQFCELMLNGQYQGIYVLIEKIKRDNNRVDIAKLTPLENTGDDLTGGYIIKLDIPPPTGIENAGWYSPFPGSAGVGDSIFINYEYPDPDSITPQQKTYIQQYVDSFETTLAGSNFSDPLNGYAKYCNVNSFIDYFIITELSKNIDGYRKSAYFYKDKLSKGGKITAGPPWDYNIAWLGMDDCENNLYTGWHYQQPDACNGSIPFWPSRLLQDTNYTNQLKCRWLELRSSVLDTSYMFSYIDSTVQYLDSAINRNYIYWDILGIDLGWNDPSPILATYAQEIYRLKQEWIVNRLAWMDANMPGICSTASVSENNIKENNISVFPNPVTSKINISIPDPSDNTKVELFDAFGNKILSQSFSAKQITLSPDIPSGIYLLQIYSKGETYFHKIVKIN